jgi:hypothetical protein
MILGIFTARDYFVLKQMRGLKISRSGLPLIHVVVLGFEVCKATATVTITIRDKATICKAKSASDPLNRAANCAKPTKALHNTSTSSETAKDVLRG